MAETSLFLSEENIYAAGFIIDLGDGRQLLKRDKTVYTPSAANDQVHTLRDTEKLWNLAFARYGNSKWWHVICDVNGIFNPFEMDTGVDIVIPDIGPIKASR